MVGRRETYVLQVKGDSMIDEQIRDGDYVIVENRRPARDGEMVIALLDGENVTLKKLYREGGGTVRLQPANAALKPIFVDQDRRAHPGRRDRRPPQVLSAAAGTLPGGGTHGRGEEPAQLHDRARRRRRRCPRVYSNFCAIQNSPFDFTLTFCEMLPLGEKRDPRGPDHARREGAGARPGSSSRSR